MGGSAWQHGSRHVPGTRPSRPRTDLGPQWGGGCENVAADFRKRRSFYPQMSDWAESGLQLEKIKVRAQVASARRNQFSASVTIGCFHTASVGGTTVTPVRKHGCARRGDSRDCPGALDPKGDLFLPTPRGRASP